MDPKLLEILKKSKRVQNATDAKYGETGAPTGGSKKASSALYEELDGTGLLTAEQAGVQGGMTSSPMADRVSVDNENYSTMVKNSKLPPAVAQAMLKNPIPQPDVVGAVSADDIRELNPNHGQPVVEEYSDEDEHDYMTEQRHVNRPQQTKQPRVKAKQVSGGISEAKVKKMIANEIAKVLPKVIENYFDKKVIQENTKLMKYVIKNSRKNIQS